MQKQNANTMWLNKEWKNPNNRDLCFCVIQEQERFNLTPSTIHNLDKVGLNELEMLNLDGCLGAKIGDLPIADIDMLNMLEEQYGILFNGSEKLLFNAGEMAITTLLNKPLNNILYARDGESWHGSALLYSDVAREYFIGQQAA